MALLGVACNDSVLTKVPGSQCAVVLNWFWIINAFKNLVKAMGSVSIVLTYQQTHNNFIIFGSSETHRGPERSWLRTETNSVANPFVN